MFCSQMEQSCLFQPIDKIDIGSNGENLYLTMFSTQATITMLWYSSVQQSLVSAFSVGTRLWPIIWPSLETERVETVESLLQDSKQILHNRVEKGRKVPSGVSNDVYGPEGREFESLRAYQNPRETLCFLRVFVLCWQGFPQLCRGVKRAYSEKKEKQEAVLGNHCRIPGYFRSNLKGRALGGAS